MRRIQLFTLAFATLVAVRPSTLRAADSLGPDAADRAASLGHIAGIVRSTEGAPVADAHVRVAGTTRAARTDSGGTFRFERLPPGTYLLEVESERRGTQVAEVRVEAAQTAEVEITLDFSVHSEEIVVTARPEAAALSDLAQPVGVLSGEELARSVRSSLGETLATQPGVSSTFFGAGASRPVIRGQGGNRVRILENGVSSSDASDTSPDHAVSLDPLAAMKIEVVRGPATLLYGSNAIGGVVNVLDDRIPDHLPDGALEGSVALLGTSNAGELAGSADFGGAVGQLAWNVAGFRREADDYESGEGLVPNSDLESDGGSLGLSWVAEGGYVGVSARRFDTNYGNPAEEEVRVDLRQRRYDLQAGTSRRLGLLDSLRFRAAVSDYEHAELESGEVGNLFENDAWEVRVDGTHQAVGPFRGALGLQASRREFAVFGEEAFVPPNDNDSWAVFLFEEAGGGRLRGLFGLRHEQQDSTAEGQPDRDFSATSASVGGRLQATDALTLALTLTRAIKVPDPEQLYANGPHIATGVFEIGDPNLDLESTLGLDLSLRHDAGRVRTELSLFANRVDDYIFETFTGEVVGGEEEEEPLPVVRFVQADAEFVGGEAEVHFELVHAEPHHLELELAADLVRAELRDSGEPLPRITPSRFSAGLRYQGEQLSGTLFVRRTNEQDRVAAFETATEGFTLLDASVGYRFFAGQVVHELLLAGTNLTDELARNHVSFLKDTAPLPGRDIRLTYRLSF
jgi:iron complex outermembrane receptor protein